MPGSLKALILAAGLGTRLRPLTDIYPKPLMPFCGTTPIDIWLNRLYDAAITDIAINTHYHADAIEQHIQQGGPRLPLHISHEMGEILGTGGCYNPLRTWLGTDAVLVVNGDVISDVDLLALIKLYARGSFAAVLSVLPYALGGGKAVFHQDGLVIDIAKTGPAAASAGTFACAYILGPEIIDLLPTSGSFDIVEFGLRPALHQGLKIASYQHSGIWHDIGTPQQYATAIWSCLRGNWNFNQKLSGHTRRQDGIYVSPKAAVNALAHLAEDAVVEDHAVVAAGAMLRRSIILPHTKIAAGEDVQNSIIAPIGRIPV